MLLLEVIAQNITYHFIVFSAISNMRNNTMHHISSQIQMIKKPLLSLRADATANISYFREKDRKIYVSKQMKYISEKHTCKKQIMQVRCDVIALL